MKEIIPHNQLLQPKEKQRKGFIKLVCLKRRPEFIKGFHYFGPNAEEIVAPIALSMKWDAGVTKEDFDHQIEELGAVSADYYNFGLRKEHRKFIHD